MAGNSNILRSEFEQKVKSLFDKHNLEYLGNYPVITMTSNRRIDMVILTQYGRILVECKYRDIIGQIAASRYAATGLFTTMYEYRQLFPLESLMVIVNDMSIFKPGQQNYIPILTSIGVEVFSISSKGEPDKYLKQKLAELQKIS